MGNPTVINRLFAPPIAIHGSQSQRKVPLLVFQWLGLSAFTAGAQVQSLVGELKSHKLRGVAK